jgi:hypothetical protein
LKTFKEKWRLQFGNEGFLKRFQLFFKTFTEHFKAFSRIARLFKYIFGGIEAFLK